MDADVHVTARPEALAEYADRTFDADQRRRVLEENPKRAFGL